MALRLSSISGLGSDVCHVQAWPRRKPPEQSFSLIPIGQSNAKRASRGPKGLRDGGVTRFLRLLIENLHQTTA